MTSKDMRLSYTRVFKAAQIVGVMSLFAACVSSRRRLKKGPLADQHCLLPVIEK